MALITSDCNTTQVNSTCLACADTGTSLIGVPSDVFAELSVAATADDLCKKQPND